MLIARYAMWIVSNWRNFKIRGAALHNMQIQDDKVAINELLIIG
jgi:hypothetical protein